MSITFARTEQMKLADLAANGDLPDIVEALHNFPLIYGKDWSSMARRIARYIGFGFQGRAPYAVFVKGNSKLPFHAFSTLPVVACPGAGDCVNWCYSLRAWRTPGAFFRQLQNTVLLRFAPSVINIAFFSLPNNATLRLYVDGDFDSASALSMWMSLLHKRPDISAYGYSKSWELLLDYNGLWPKNYRLNVSSGSKYGDDIKRQILALTITRGEFIAVPIDIPKMINNIKYQSPIYKHATRTSAKSQGIERAFLCPGQCGTCTKSIHACGSELFTDIPIVIGIH